jgi:Zn-dependent protease with chaperone function
MEIKLTRLNLERQFDLHLLFKMHKVEVFSCTRAAAEAAGISSVCAFADTTNKYVVLIEDDCQSLSPESIRTIMCHELAHVIIPSIDEAQADEFAARFVNPKAVQIAREETEKVRLRIRYARAAGIYTPAEIF